MALVDEVISISINKRNVGIYRNLGYDLPSIDYPYNALVHTKDLPKNSQEKITVECDYCGSTFLTKKQLYSIAIENSISKKVACKQCRSKKLKDGMQTRYGVQSAFNIEEVKKKIAKTNKEKFGAENVFSSSQIQEKIHKTNLEKYGVEYAGQIESGKIKSVETSLERYGVTHPSKSKTVQDKKVATNLKKYGVPYNSQTKEYKEKVLETNLRKYGVEHYNQLPERREFARNRLAEVGELMTSKSQNKICDLVGGKLNHPCHGFFLDVLFEDWLDIEYNGGGHDLGVKLGQMTQAQFDKKEKQRTAAVLGYGYKQLVIYNSNPSKRDKLPEDEVTKEILNKCIFFLKNFEDKLLALDLDTMNLTTFA